MTMMNEEKDALRYINVGKGREKRSIACIVKKARRPRHDLTLVWLGGYRSDMSGTKAIELEAHAGRLKIHSLRFDYSGHGASGGDFKDGTISRWLEEALAAIDKFARGRLILAGSSMGGWVALRVIQELRKRGEGERLAGLVLIAPAPDFTSDLIEPELTGAEHASLAERGYFEEASEYSDQPNIYTRALIEDGRANRVLTAMIQTGCPVHVLQGMRDPDVPYQHALKLMEHLAFDDVVMSLIRDGDHRLSRPEDIARITAAITAIVEPA